MTVTVWASSMFNTCQCNSFPGSNLITVDNNLKNKTYFNRVLFNCLLRTFLIIIKCKFENSHHDNVQTKKRLLPSFSHRPVHYTRPRMDS